MIKQEGGPHSTNSKHWAANNQVRGNVAFLDLPKPAAAWYFTGYNVRLLLAVILGCGRTAAPSTSQILVAIT